MGRNSAKGSVGVVYVCVVVLAAALYSLSDSSQLASTTISHKALSGRNTIAVADVRPIKADQKIAEQLAETTTSQGQLSNCDITIRVESGNVKLAGRVATTQQLRQLLATVKQHPRVIGITNQIRVSTKSRMRAGLRCKCSDSDSPLRRQVSR